MSSITNKKSISILIVMGTFLLGTSNSISKDFRLELKKIGLTSSQYLEMDAYQEKLTQEGEIEPILGFGWEITNCL